MKLLRFVRETDLDALYELSLEAGLTSLPPERKYLAKKIASSIQSQKIHDNKVPHWYMFVLEDLACSKVVGVCAIVSCIGLDVPFYSFKVDTHRYISKEFKVDKKIQLLNLVNDIQDYAEICSLYLKPEYRKKLYGHLLSRSRMLFMGQFPELFPENVIAEMRGYVDENGKVPFWESVGSHFFPFDFTTADFFEGKGHKQFIRELMPPYPIYINLLPDETQKIIGQVHEQTKPAMRMLQHEGFRTKGYVDIFDAGPTIEAKISELHTVKNSQVGIIAELEKTQDGKTHLISNADFDFKATLGHVEIIQSGQVRVSKLVADTLGVDVGDKIRFIR